MSNKNKRTIAYAALFCGAIALITLNYFVPKTDCITFGALGFFASKFIENRLRDKEGPR